MKNKSAALRAQRTTLRATFSKKSFTTGFQSDTIQTNEQTEDSIMLIKTFAAEYFYFYFTFFRGKVNFAAMG
ncbi:MAG: hypothetical protein Q4C25_05015 [Bacillota bacterium]|nr:hypothetical protein [Bacillota bacterium]